MQQTTPYKTRAHFPDEIPDSTNLPRLLFLHGGGVNAKVFQAQSRSLIRHLQYSFRCVFADGPFMCEGHPDILQVYGTYAPFRRWLRWLPKHEEVEDETVIKAVGNAIRTAMEQDEGTGEWVGMVGFSQGAKLAASILLEQQAREKTASQGRDGGDGLIGIPGLKWRFAVCLAGRAPLSNLNPDLLKSKALVPAAGLSEGFEFVEQVDDEAVLKAPTLHVHGLRDAGLHLHRRLLEDYCDRESAMLVEWDGAHRIPIKSEDVEKIMDGLYDLVEQVGIEGSTRTV
ncbi:citrinin biosynthesis oxidoreductase-like protein CtnB [Sporormia fimetaria CBS 119925]|uniref:Citrinin biosynthesis oxidoreductase-like protein CtnB n=1 Tax=Sporormia fimetaria CBS 119925 TaxID=1340428 RepID=A0A6A6VL96_9PLEO|nr:citrinin biosynthesis oxidoreductase-like protein CtnB [Sporormia fimetaria CBS 119925]